MASKVSGKQVNDIGEIDSGSAPTKSAGVSHNIRGDILSIMKGDSKSEQPKATGASPTKVVQN